MVCKYILLFLYVKEALTVHERWPKSKQSKKKKKYTAARIIHKYMLHVTARTLFLYQAHLITSNINPFRVLKIYVEQKLLHFLNDSPSPPPPPSVWCGKSLRLPVSPKDTPPPPIAQKEKKKGVSNEILYQYVLPRVFLPFAACSKLLSDGVFSQFTNSETCIRAAFKKEACSFASHSDMGLTPCYRFWDSVPVRVFRGLLLLFFLDFLHRSSLNESGAKNKKNRGWPYELW